MLQISFTSTQRPPVWLVKSRYTIGRDKSCDIWLSDPAVAALHAELLVDDGAVRLIPHMSHPVSVNRQPVKHSIDLELGSLIRLGETEFAVADSHQTSQAANDGAGDAVLNGWYLQGKTTALSNRQYPVKDEMILGRAKDCDISLAVAHLSRRHARIRVRDTCLEIEDLDSVNGTFLNRQQIKKATAHLGDELRFDTLCFRVSHRYEGSGREQFTSMRAVAPRSAPGTSGASNAAAKAVSAKAVSSVAATPRKARRRKPMTSDAGALTTQSRSIFPLVLGFMLVAAMTGTGMLYLAS